MADISAPKLVTSLSETIAIGSFIAIVVVAFINLIVDMWLQIIWIHKCRPSSILAYLFVRMSRQRRADLKLLAEREPIYARKVSLLDKTWKITAALSGVLLFIFFISFYFTPKDKPLPMNLKRELREKRQIHSASASAGVLQNPGIEEKQKP